MKLRCVFNELMRKHHRQSVLLGRTSSSTAEDFFGFHPSQVEAVHFHKRNVGAGVWFRLQCGRVVDEVAVPTCRDADLYGHAVTRGGEA